MADENTPVAAPAEEVKIDDSSINHATAARRNSLEKHLAQRPERAELVESESLSVPSLRTGCDTDQRLPENILPASNAAPSLQAQQKEVRPAVLPKVSTPRGVLAYLF